MKLELCMLYIINSYLTKFSTIRNLYYLPRIIKYKIYVNRLRKEAKRKNKSLLFYLHIGKTGGTAIKNALGLKSQHLETQDFIIVPPRDHRFNLRDTRKGDKVFFSIREPKKRVISGFHSRKRKNNSNIYYEKEVLNYFKTGIEMAEALSSEDNKNREKAKKGMKYIQHVKNRYHEWLISSRYLRKRKNDIYFILRQENLNKDFEKLIKRLNLPSNKYYLPNDPILSHKNIYNSKLTNKANKNLEKWVRSDIELIEEMKELNLINTNYFH